MLREEVEQYTKLTGEDGSLVPVVKIGTYLDGYNRGLEVLDKIRAEIEQITDTMGVSYNQYVSKIDVLQIIDKYRKRG